MCRCSGAGNPAPLDPPFVIAGGNARQVVAFFEPTTLVEAAVTMSFWNADTQLGQATMLGVGGNPWAKAHTLHPVVSGDTVFTEPDAAGGAEVRHVHQTPHCRRFPSKAHLSVPASLPRVTLVVTGPWWMLKPHRGG